MKLLLFLSFIIIVASQNITYDQDFLEEFDLYFNATQKLYKKLFDDADYKKDMAPIFGRINIPVHLLLELSYMRLIEIDSETQQVSLVLEIINHWSDLRLRWDPEDYNGVNVLFVNSGILWIPEYSASDSQEFELLAPDAQRFARLYNNGTVYYETTIFMKFSCKLNMWNFPFDVQSCGIGFQTYSLTKQGFNLSTKVSEVMDPSVLEGNGEWCIISLTNNYTVEVPTLSLAGFQLRLHREPLFYVFVIVLPCFLLTTLSNFGMFWSSRVKEDKLGKMSLGLASMMAMTVLLDLASQQIHKNANFPLLGWYVIICTILISLGCIMVVLISNGCQQVYRKPKPGLLAKLEQYVFSRAFGAHLLFQGANLTNLIYFLSHWKGHPNS
ncbi:unnamed protein product, partial [Mesorhabditis belari]|uniref:Neurotransmitter-gated ion-channel ligand-binding domain-containing protein n=1 Tax=Mesorhabditis belari TaxID=2138241 RepID=A0AAF3FJI2_9BILA